MSRRILEDFMEKIFEFIFEEWVRSGSSGGKKRGGVGCKRQTPKASLNGDSLFSIIQSYRGLSSKVI